MKEKKKERSRPGVTDLILAYAAENRKIILLWLCAAACFAVVFYLCGLPLSPVLYALLLSAVFFGAAAVCGFLKFRRRHRELSDLKRAITVTQEPLPRPHGLIGRDYSELVETVLNDRAKIISSADSARADMMEYYTAWVHQIKTPIAAMRLLLQSEPHILQQYTGCTEPYAACEPLKAELLEELFKTEQYVDMALQYVRLDSETTDFLFREYSLDDIIRQAVRKFSSVFIRKKIILDYEETGLSLVTDEKWFVFVLEQILSNALKYTDSGGRISVRTETADHRAGRACADPEEKRRADQKESEGLILVIEDSGVGIAPQDLTRVFEKGFTGYNGRLNRKSTGIGLYLCRRVMDRLSHSIEIESEPGRGTKVKIGLDRYQLKGD